MRPLEPLEPMSPIARLLRGAPAVEVRAELSRLDALALDRSGAAARTHAHGALALRDGALDRARACFLDAADAFARAGEIEAAALARCEAWLAAIRRGPRAIYAEAGAALDAIAREHAGRGLVEVVALHYRGTAERFDADALATQRTLLEALAKSGPYLPERAQILTSLGTLYVVLGAFGAAEAMLEHAAELHHQHGDAVGEAIAFGQLGSAALGRGEPERARRPLQRQEWLASRVGDAFGQARALVFLADVALGLGRPDDALAMATEARAVAERVTPSLTIWIAYAARARGRAMIELDDTSAEGELRAAADGFAAIGNELGAALVRWDLAHLAARRAEPAGGPDASEEGFRSAAWALGSLGLPARVAELLSDRRALAATPRALEETLATAAQGTPHLVVAQELRLAYEAPDELAAIAERRGAAQRNLARLAALTLAPRGLVVAAIAASAIGRAATAHELVRGALPPLRAAAAAIAELPGLVVWVWASDTPAEAVARDLAAARARLGEDTRAAVEPAHDGRVVSPPFSGEVGANVEAVPVLAIAARAMALAPAALAVARTLVWSADAAGLAALAGYVVAR
jgi:hypothetical protein